MAISPKFLLLSISAFILIGCTDTVNQRKLETQQKLGRTPVIAVIPAKSEFTISDVSGNVTKDEQKKQELEISYNQEIQRQIATKGYKIVDTSTSEFATTTDFQISNYEVGYNLNSIEPELVPLFMRTRSGKATKTFDANTTSALGAMFGANYLLISKISVNDQTGGAMARDFAATVALAMLTGSANGQGGASPHDVITGQASYASSYLVEANTGNIIWYNVSAAKGWGVEGNTYKIAKENLADFPSKNEVVKVK